MDWHQGQSTSASADLADLHAGKVRGRSGESLVQHIPVQVARVDSASLVQTPLAETPLFVGRAVAAFARDRTKFGFSGKAFACKPDRSIVSLRSAESVRPLPQSFPSRS